MLVISSNMNHYAAMCFTCKADKVNLRAPPQNHPDWSVSMVGRLRDRYKVLRRLVVCESKKRSAERQDGSFELTTDMILEFNQWALAPKTWSEVEETRIHHLGQFCLLRRLPGREPRC